MNKLSFFVTGIPVGKGSMKAFVPPGGKYAGVTHDGAKSKPWASSIAFAAAEEAKRVGWQPILGGGIRVALRFDMPRPQGHYGSGKNVAKLKPSAPMFHTTKPDIDKMARLLLDALKGIVWKDDSQVVGLQVAKRYAVGTVYGVSIEVESSV